MNPRAQITLPVVDLLRHPDGPRDRQVLFGETFELLEVDNGWRHIRADKDGFTGFVPESCLGPVTPATHWISAASTHVYARADLKSPDLMALGFGSLITAISLADGYVRTSQGFIPAPHVTPNGTHLSDPVDVARLFMGTPYLWGGNSRWGIDCSGLVQAAYVACGQSCPGDSGMQMDALGPELPPGSEPQRNDLLFFKGHVAMVYDPDTLLHANAMHMAVSFEPLHPTLARIEAQGDGKVIRHVRPLPK